MAGFGNEVTCAEKDRPEENVGPILARLHRQRIGQTAHPCRKAKPQPLLWSWEPRRSLAQLTGELARCECGRRRSPCVVDS